jgi:hypothetical protein
MKKNFRTPADWKSALMTLPDGSFFELMRSIFGNIKTPFNKQKLLDDLSAFLSREDIQAKIGSYIDETDAAVIAAIAVMKEPAPGELESFFAGELNCASLQDLLLNLEERFILYRFRENGTSRLALNPVLEPVLAPFTANLSLLFPSYPGEGKQEQEPSAPQGDLLIAGIISFIMEEPRLLKAEGGLRKKILNTGKGVFSEEADLESLIGGLQILGLIRTEEDRFLPDWGKLRAFAKLSRRERMEYWAAGIACLETETRTEAAVYLNRKAIFDTAQFFHRLLGLLDPAREYPLSTLKRCAAVLEREDEAGISPDGAVVPFESFLNALEASGLLRRKRDRLIAGTAFGEEKTGRTVLAMDAPFSWIVYPGIAFDDALSLASFSVIRETGAAVRFELTRDSAVRGFDRGISAKEMTGLLSRLSGREAGEPLSWTAKDWEKRYGEVALEEGIVLTLAEDRRYLAEAEPVKALIKKTFTPGIYLLNAPETEEAAEALRKAGVDIIARRDYTPEQTYRLNFPAMTQLSAALVPGEAAAGPAGNSAAARGELKARFREILGTLKITKEERDELSSRIDRRLILSESQLEGASIRYEKLEARGIDYAGKTNLAKQAIASKSLLEVIWPRGGGSNEARGIPLAIEKKEGESILVLENANVGEPSLRIPLGKISLLRRIKKSIFGE